VIYNHPNEGTKGLSMNTNKRLLITILVIVLVACLVISALLIIGATLFIARRSSTPVVETIETIESAPTATPIASQGSTPPSSDLPANVASEMDEIQQQVISMRGLQPFEAVNRALMTEEELRDRVENDFFKDYTAQDASDDVRILSTLGLLPPDYDIYKLYVDLYSEQIAGFYDNETKEMYVTLGEGWKGTERMTYAHEYTHFLQDQTYDLRDGLGMNDDACEVDTERCAGIQALIEGDASLTEALWYQTYATDQDKQEISDFYDTYTSPVYDAAPYYLQQDFLFPYQQGALFVQSLFMSNGWDAVDAAYGDVPVSTEQILHPERYPTDKPANPDLPDFTTTLGDGWEELERNNMGEWYTYLILSAGNDPKTRIDEETAATAAEGWLGDTYIAFLNRTTNNFVLVWQQEWETAADADEYWSAITQFARAFDGADIQNRQMTWTDYRGNVRLLRIGNTTYWLVAPDQAINDQIWLLLNQ